LQRRLSAARRLIDGNADHDRDALTMRERLDYIGVRPHTSASCSSAIRRSPFQNTTTVAASPIEVSRDVAARRKSIDR
jgi:hypothetical protein